MRLKRKKGPTTDPKEGRKERGLAPGCGGLERGRGGGDPFCPEGEEGGYSTKENQTDPGFRSTPQKTNVLDAYYFFLTSILGLVLNCVDDYRQTKGRYSYARSRSTLSLSQLWDEDEVMTKLDGLVACLLRRIRR